ncbi:MAG TPA: tetraacyldisaccharide 4'-kinase [Candidatus Thioglobus sp.]|nr:tetraacyldisaccharide 4'-kinase [Candidatus Thioglobus sp.]
MDLNRRGVVNYALLPISGFFYVLSKIRKAFYRLGIFRVNQFDIPIVVVGNITVGGSGKTPVVIKLVEYLQQQGKKVGVVSRGYGGSHESGSLLVDSNSNPTVSGDEPLLIATQTGVAVMVNKNRSEAVTDLLKQQALDVIISDDGLQHYSMGRSIEVVVVDGNRRFGNNFYLPAGPLRESQAKLKQVDFVINNGSTFPGEIPAKLMPVSFVHLLSGKEFSLDYFKGQYCHGAAGIGDPDRFFNTLDGLGVEVKRHAFMDHYQYQANDLKFEDNHPIIMTAKDWVKCKKFANEQMFYLKVDLEISENFLNKLLAKL